MANLLCHGPVILPEPVWMPKPLWCQSHRDVSLFQGFSLSNLCFPCQLLPMGMKFHVSELAAKMGTSVSGHQPEMAQDDFDPDLPRLRLSCSHAAEMG